MNKVFTIILIKYLNYHNIFLIKDVIKFLKLIKINNYAIELKKNKQSFFNLIYNLNLIKQKMLKTYIKIGLANNFISFFKFFIRKFKFFN